jgi:hypothetical protein
VCEGVWWRVEGRRGGEEGSGKAEGGVAGARDREDRSGSGLWRDKVEGECN